MEKIIPSQSRSGGGALPTSMSGGVYGTLPNRRSAFTRLAGVAAANGRWNATAELEDYARQYEDLYSRRMNHGANKGGSNASSSTANTGSNSNSSNGYWFHNSR